jgi:hypothetical protein
MADTDVQIKFGAEISELQAGVGGAKAAIGDVSAAVKDLKSAFSEVSKAPAGALRETGDAAGQAGAGAAAAASGFAAVLGPLGEVAGLVVTAAQQMWALGQQVWSLGQKMGETAEQALHTAQTLGLTVGQVQQLNAEAALFGVPAQTMTSAMQGLDRSFAAARGGAKVQAAAFKDVGVSLHGSYSQTQLMQAALEGLSRMAPGPAKTAAAVALFGKSIEDIAPLLGLTTAQVEGADKTIAEYGAVNEQAAAKGVALADAFNVNKVAMMGVNSVLADALAPVLAQIVSGVNQLVGAFTQSYRSGGLVKDAMDVLTLAVKIAADFIGSLSARTVTAFEGIDGAIGFFWSLLDPLVRAVVGAVGAMVDAFKTFGDVVRDAFTLNWDKIGSDISGGMARVRGDIVRTAGQMGRDASDAFQHGAAAWASGGKAMAGYKAWSKTLWSGGETPEMPKAQPPGALPAGSAGAGHVQSEGATAPPVASPGAPLAGANGAQIPAAADAISSGQIDAFARSLAQELGLAETHQTKLTAAATQGSDVRVQVAGQAADQTKTQWDQAVDSMVNDFAQGLVRIARGTETWSKLWNSLTERMESQFARNVSNMLTDWLHGDQGKQQSAQQTASVTTQAQQQGAQQGLMAHLAATVKQITADAAKAASSTYAAVAAIPLVGPFLAPEAAAAAFAAVMAFEGMASAEGGYDIPYGINPITQLHQNEMVLPATVAQPLRGFLRDYGAAGEGPWGGSGGRSGDTHITLNHAPSISGGAPADVIRHLESNKLAFAKMLNRMARDGHFKPAMGRG